ncbi:RNA 2',3'-cyclic phosphodiesterase [Mangrovibacterium lignilyticum]|uniref:RNA 2',3'-cyclic phosphodiesterase n=1 Tax=Mangrovibacterium lignilyticum TaxID=2668052 RepID=UPI0013D352B1|nr:RNA 2',3'-cyclic phosphodiesterase [Mangrovibacterium lignilyticum]
MKRTFVAIKIELQPAFQELIGKLKRSLDGEKIRWVIPENFHLTLHFFGNTEADDVAVLIELFQDFAEAEPPINFKLKAISFFKKRLQPKVLFVDVAEADELEKLAEKLHEVLVDKGFAKAEHAFHPHLTVARIKHLDDKERFLQVLKQFSESPEQLVEATELVFYESVVRPDGPVYRPIKTFELNG